MHISAFDLDHTLLTVNCSFEFGKYLYSNKHLSISRMLFLASCYAAHVVGVIPVGRLHQLNFEVLFKGQPLLLYQKLVSKFLDEHLDGYIFAPAFEAYQQAQTAGHYTAILSTSPDFIVQAIAQRFNASHTSSTIYHADPGGILSHLGLIMHGEEKAAVLRALAKDLQVTKENIYVYSDSHLDLPFLEAAGHAIAVRPNRQLREISSRKGWTILS